MNRSREHRIDLAIGRLSEESARAISPITISGLGLLLALRLTRP